MEFPSTIWTAIRNAQKDPRGARDLIIRRYWEPVRRYAEIKGLAPEDAEDLAQTVFLHICRDGFLERADRNKGKFRSLLMAIANNLMRHGWRQKYAPDGSGQRREVQVEEERLYELADGKTTEPDAQFDQVWAENIVKQVLGRLREESERLKTPYFQAVEAFYFRKQSYEEIAASLGTTEGRVKNYVFRGKALLRDLVRNFIHEYSGSADEYESELRDLKAFLQAVT